MKKLSASALLAVLAMVSLYGCVVDDGRRGNGHDDHMDHHPGPGPGDRDDHHDNRRDDRRGPGDRDDHH